MRIEKIARDKTGLFSGLANDLVYNQAGLSDFIIEPFSIEAFENQIQRKKNSYSSASRKVLVEVLTKNYGSKISATQQENLKNLASENTFTVTTGHQLSLATGPLYFVIKILHVSKMAIELKKKFPAYDFVPIFWMASEDHDFEEINQVNLFNQKWQWNTEQKGAVGRFGMENWEQFRNEIGELFKNHPESEVMDILNLYQGGNLSEATFNLVNALFKDYGVLTLDADNVALKSLFAGIVKEEILENKAESAVEKTNKLLEDKELSTQAHAREINVFLLADQKRERIQRKGDGFFVEGIGDFSQEEMLNMLEEDPSQFSPNVILRPVYQECILPNLCYVGGGGEMAYWLQLKGVFEVYHIPYPLIQVRNSLMLIDEGTSKKMETINWNSENLFEDLDQAKKKFVLNQTEELDFNDLREKQMHLVSAARQLVAKVDPNLNSFVEAEMTRMSKQIENLEQKLIRAEKAKFEKSLKQMDQVKDKLFPGGGLQERHTNFFQFCADGQVFTHLNQIAEAIDPFEKDFTVCYF